jgi:hypothetical protein
VEALIPAPAASQCQPVHSTEKHTLAACPGVFPEEKFNLIYILLGTSRSITKRWPLKKVQRSISSRYLAGPGLQNKKIHVPYLYTKRVFKKVKGLGSYTEKATVKRGREAG